MFIRTRWIAISSLTLGSLLFSLMSGSVTIGWHQLLLTLQEKDSLTHTILLQIRLPRTFSAFTTGGLLALAGNLMQILLQNPLADPYVLGISGGAALFALLTLFLGLGASYLIAGASLGGLLAMLLILFLAQTHRFQSHRLVLVGIILASGFSACISLILLLSPDQNLHSMLFWLSGDFNNTQAPWIALIILILGVIVTSLLAPGLNILTRGEKEAKALGLKTTHYRLAIYLLTSIFTATAVTLAGCIGFIGLIIPHLTRLLVGNDQRVTIPLSALIGGSFLTIADTFSRTILSPQQIPVGIVMAFIGIPIFLGLLMRIKIF